MENQTMNLGAPTDYKNITSTCRSLDVRMDEIGEMSNQEEKAQEKQILVKEAEDLLEQCRIYRRRYRDIYNLPFIESVAKRIKATIGDL